jgi:hypothetical protein
MFNKIIAIVFLFSSSMSFAFDDGAVVKIRSLINSQCLDAAGGGTSNNTNIQTFKCHNNDNQKIELVEVNKYDNFRWFQLIDVNSGLCYDIRSGSTA